ncbi:hypothetical protein HQ865_01120 [Mucilaginibacter mali]|uniref:Uncharacterized protein n=1 Tax=Mucilaginibacter mali TaxID=2740462 RepID=A0A7D4TSL8_9SPHI|nr:hypothetical protein [Mucilaginibacter mali]QKJ28415.1 hypothetical protein HQ865_01120 [Mucilaginibacter mali]
MRVSTLIIVVALVAAAYWFWMKKQDDDGGILPDVAKEKKAIVNKAVQNGTDIANTAILLHDSMSQSWLRQAGVSFLQTGIVGQLLHTTDRLDFSVDDSWAGLLKQSDKAIISINNYFNARYKNEGKGNLYKWVTDHLTIPLSRTRKLQTQLLDKLKRLGCA